MSADDYVDLLISEWGLEKHSSKLQACMRRALTELTAESQFVFRREPRLQVAVVPDRHSSVWAYFPIHRRRTIVSGWNIQLKHGTRVLLVISEKQMDSDIQFMNHLRDHLGHVLLYLRKPKARNECENASREWRESCA